MQMRIDTQPAASAIYPDRHLPDPSAWPTHADPGQTQDLGHAARLVWRRRWLVVLCVLFGVSLSSYVAFHVMMSYSARALLVVGETQQGGTRDADDIAIDTQIALLTSPAQLNMVLQSLWEEPRFRKIIPRYRDLERHLKVMQELKSRVIAIIFTAKSPAVAAEVANRVATLYVDGVADRLQSFDEAANQGAKQTAELQNALQRSEARLAQAQKQGASNAVVNAIKVQIAQLTEAIETAKVNQRLAERRNEDRLQMQAQSPPVRLIALATPPDFPSSFPPIIIIVPAFFASLIFGTGLALLLGRLDQRFYDASDLAAAFDAPCLGAVPDAKCRRRASKLIPQSRSRTYAFESIITGLLLAAADRPKITLITSCRNEQGKTSFASNFAAVATRLHRRVLLVDLDTVRSSPESHLAGTPGLFDILAGDCAESDAIKPAVGLALDILPIGKVGDDPLAALSSDRLATLLYQLKANYDCVVINGAPVLDVTETRLIAAKADQIILVVRSRLTRQSDVSEALGLLLSSARGFSAQARRIATVLATRPVKQRHDDHKEKKVASRSSKPAVAPVKPAVEKSAGSPPVDMPQPTQMQEAQSDVDLEVAPVSAAEAREPAAEDSVAVPTADAPQTPLNETASDSGLQAAPAISVAKRHIGHRPKHRPARRVPIRPKLQSTKRQAKKPATSGRRRLPMHKNRQTKPRKYALIGWRSVQPHPRMTRGKKLNLRIVRKKKSRT